MSGTPLNPARLAGLMATVAKSFPLQLLTDEVCKSWEDNGAELAARLAFLADLAPPPKKKGRRKRTKIAMVNPSEFFVTSDKRNIAADFISRIDLSPCEDDSLELKPLFTLSRDMNDSEIATKAGGKDTLRIRRATPAQLMRELKLVLAGRLSLFVKGNNYLLYLEGSDGELCPVSVCWVNGDLFLDCYDFDEGGLWISGFQVIGN
jgi:hypothetical protein